MKGWGWPDFVVAVTAGFLGGFTVMFYLETGLSASDRWCRGDSPSCLRDWLLVAGTWFGVVAAVGAGYILWRQVADQREHYERSRELQLRETKLRALNDLREVYAAFLGLSGALAVAVIETTEIDEAKPSFVNVGENIFLLARATKALKSDAFEQLLYRSERSELRFAAANLDVQLDFFSRRWVIPPEEGELLLADGKCAKHDGYYLRTERYDRYPAAMERIRDASDRVVAALDAVRAEYEIGYDALYSPTMRGRWKATFPERHLG